MRGETYILIVYLYIQHYMFNYSLYIIINRNILFNAIVTRMNKYIIITTKMHIFKGRKALALNLSFSQVANSGILYLIAYNVSLINLFLRK